MTDKAKTRRGLQSRARIIATTRALLAETDLHSLKLDIVADKSGVAKSSVLWHFGSKNGLLLAVVEDIFAGMLPLIQGLRPDTMDRRERLRRMMGKLAEELQNKPEANTLLISFIVNRTQDQSINAQIRKMYDSYREFIAQALSSSGVTGNALLPSLVLAIIDGAFLQWHLQPEKIDLQELLVQSVDLIRIDAPPSITTN